MSLYNLYQELRPAKPTYSVKDVPDQTGKVVFITGGTSGLGFETARVFLSKGAKVYITSRNAESAASAVQKLHGLVADKKADVQSIICELGDLHSVKAAAVDFLTKESSLHILYNNGGVMFPEVSQLTKQGLDLQFGVHVLAHHVLTKELLPILLSTAAAAPAGTVRVVNLSSMAQLSAPKGGIDFATLKDGPARKQFDSVKLYQQSKAGVVVYSSALAKRYGDKGITSVSLNPGNIRTGIQRHILGFKAKILDMTLSDVSLGVLTQLYAGVATPEVSLNGKYLRPYAQLGTARPDLEDKALEDKLWTWLEEESKGI